MLASVAGTPSRKCSILPLFATYRLIQLITVPPPGTPGKAARDITGVYGNGQAPCSIVMNVSSLLHFTLGEHSSLPERLDGANAGVTDSAKTFSTPSTKSSYVSRVLVNFERLKVDCVQIDRRLVRHSPSSGEQEIFAKLLPTQLPLRMDRYPGGLRRLKVWNFVQLETLQL
jgi:hypothetical protein